MSHLRVWTKVLELFFTLYLRTDPAKGHQASSILVSGAQPTTRSHNMKFLAEGLVSASYEAVQHQKQDKGAIPTAILETTCAEDSDCETNITRRFTCTAESQGEMGNCTCPEFTPVLLQDEDHYQCYKLGTLRSPCERVEQCAATNRYLRCEDGVCACPANLTVKLGFKCMPARPLHSNCTSIDSCSEPYIVCVDGKCVCRIYYAEENNTCVYRGDASWKIICLFALPVLLAIAFLGFLMSVAWQMINESRMGYEDATSTSIVMDFPEPAPGIKQQDMTLLTCPSPSLVHRSGLTSPAWPDNATAMNGAELVLPVNIGEGKYGSRDLQHQLVALSEREPERDNLNDVKYPRRYSYPGAGSRTPEPDPQFLHPIMKLSEREAPAAQEPAEEAVPEIYPPAGSSARTFPPGPRSIIKKRGHSNPAILSPDNEKDDAQQRTRKVVRIGPQEISSTVKYVPYGMEYNTATATASSSLAWPTLKEDVFEARFPKLAALSRRSIDAALRTVAEETKQEKSSKQQRRRRRRRSDTIDVQAEDSFLSVEGLGLTTGDFVDTSDNIDSFQLPQLRLEDMSKRFPQLAQLDQPTFSGLSK